jgi:protein-export membrane protein SecD
MKALKAILFFPFDALRWIWRVLTIPFWAKGAKRERYLLVVILLLGFFAAAVVYPPVWNKPAAQLKPRIEYTGSRIAEMTGWSWPRTVAEWKSPEPFPATVLGRNVSEFSLGLDLVGGAHLEYKADVSGIEPGDVDEKMGALRDAIERRVNIFGVSEPVVQVAESGEEQRLIVELAGIQDIEQAIELVGQTAHLEFRTQNPDAPEAPDLSALSQEGLSEEEQQALLEQYLQFQNAQWLPTTLNGEHLERAQVGFADPLASGQGSGLNQIQIQLDFTDEGAELFRELTAANIGQQLAIFLDDNLLSAPTVQQEITGGTAVITGDYTIEAARQQVSLLNAGALPIDVELVAQRTVGATLGEQSLQAMLRAGTWTAVLIVLFMLLIYRLPGLAALVALTLYGVFMLALYKLVPVTMTLAGIAGFILSVGMAVDANILVFARMREERKRGRTPVAMVEEGFARAWTAIRDSGLSTLLTTAILYTVGTSFVQGFALALGIGVVVSLLTAFIISRFLLREIVRHPKLTNRFLF